MQLYIRPYPHSTYTNMPYDKVKGTANYGFFDIKKYPGKIKDIKEVTQFPRMVDLIKVINSLELLRTFGCDISYDVITFQPKTVLKSYINLCYDSEDTNKYESMYYKFIADLLKLYDEKHKSENSIIEFIINPTNFHSMEKYKKGVSIAQKTLLYSGYSLNISILGMGDDSATAYKAWESAIDFITNNIKKAYNEHIHFRP